MNNHGDQTTELGYRFIPFTNRESFGYRELIINIPERPSGEHFDPVEVHVPASFMDRTVLEPLTIFHPFMAGQHIEIAPGRICIADRKGKKEEAFSFGGSMLIENLADRTICRLTSPAPILYANHSSAHIQNLIDEIQILLAERRAAWIRQGEHAFEQRLLQPDPVTLYTSCLSAILKEFKDHDLQALGANRTLVAMIRHEILDLKSAGEWPSSIPSMEDLL